MRRVSAHYAIRASAFGRFLNKGRPKWPVPVLVWVIEPQPLAELEAAAAIRAFTSQVSQKLAIFKSFLRFLAHFGLCLSKVFKSCHAKLRAWFLVACLTKKRFFLVVGGWFLRFSDPLEGSKWLPTATFRPKPSVFGHKRSGKPLRLFKNLRFLRPKPSVLVKKVVGEGFF